jgi:glycosyltransferase involved in cell wall biosynthesis
MRIGINASFARKPDTGIGQVTINFLKELARHKTKHEFIIYLEKDIDFKLPKNFTKRIFLPLWRRDDLIRKIRWEKSLLPKKAKKDKCDIFLSLYQCPTIIHNVKHIMVVHDIIPKLFPEYLNNARKELYSLLTEKSIIYADKIISISKRTEKDLTKHLGVDPAKITVNYPDVDEIFKKKVINNKNQEVLKKYRLSPGYILSGGGLEVRKNIESVIRAYKFILHRNKHGYFLEQMPKLVIWGKLLPQLAPLVTDVKKLVKELNLTGWVKILDFVPQNHLPALYKNASIFIYPSKYEGFGLPVLEAMNLGKPVITSKTSSLPEVGADAVLYTDPDSIRDIAMVMKNVLTNEKLRATLSERAKNRAKIFSWKNFTKKTLNIIDATAK